MFIAQTRRTLAAVVTAAACVVRAETCTPTNIVVAPLTGAHWTQGAPYNDYSPKGTTVFTSGWEAGCVAIAAAQELYLWQWPWRLDAVRETSHPVLSESNLALRFDGNVPFDWENMRNAYGSGATLKQKHAAAHLVLACQSLVQMRFVSGGGEAMKNLPGTMEWYEYAGQVTPRASDANLAALKADLEFGSPVQTGINFKGYGGHEVVGLGYATGTNSVGEAKNLIWLNLGWGGGSDGWYDIGETDTSETIIKSTQLGFRPIKSVQIEPLAPVNGSSVTLNWHLPNCYTNKISGFTVAKKRLSASTTTWSDDFSMGGRGRSSNTNEMRVANGGLMAWDGTASAIYTWDEKFMLTADSVLTYDIGSAYMSGMSARMEAKFGNDGWQTIHALALEGGKGDGNYYNWGTMTTGLTANLGEYAGKIVQLRLVVEYTTGGVYNSNDANMKIDNLSVSNVKTFETVETDGTIAASARSAAFNGLTTGGTYAFSVTPIMSDGSEAVTQTATTTIGTPAASPVITAVTMSPKGTNLVQEGFYADIAMGRNTIDVACENVTSLEAFPSHQNVLPQGKVAVVNNGGGSFSINIDASEVAAKWSGQRMILTLKATNATGETAYKDLELCLVKQIVPVAVWDGDFSPSELTKFSGYELVDWNQTHGGVSHGAAPAEDYSSVTIDRTNQGLMFNAASAMTGMTVIVRYSNLSKGSSHRVLFTSCVNSSHSGYRTGVRLGSGGYINGMWQSGDYGTAAGTVDASGVMAFTYSTDGTYLYAGSAASSLVQVWGSSALKSSSDTSIYGAGIGGFCAGSSIGGYEAAQGMTVEAIAVFTNVLTVAEMNAYKWPSETVAYVVVEKTTATTGFPVPYSWIEACFPGIAGYPDAMYETMANSPGDNGYKYWESYVLGLDPTNALSRFTATIRMEGQKPIVEFSPTNETLCASGAIEYILQGKPTFTNDWQDVDFADPGATNRLFRVRIRW